MALLLLVPAASEAAEVSTPSGRPIPRWVTLRGSAVNARANPDRRERIIWVYHAKGLPLQVIAETKDWRRVCDPDGQVAWVFSGNLAAARGAMNLQPEPAPLRRSPDFAAAVSAVVGPRAILRLDHCRAGWCEVRATRLRGWTPLGRLWGTLDHRQCRGA